MKQTFIIQPDPHPARRRAMQAVADATPGQRITIADPVKSRGQEEKYHAMLGDLSAQWTLHGRKWDAESMKRLCVDQFQRETKNDPDLKEEWEELAKVQMVPSIDGSGVVLLGVQTRKFSRKLAGAFVEWLYSLGAEVGIVWSEPRQAAQEPAHG